jgi:hypothetical protein
MQSSNRSISARCAAPVRRRLVHLVSSAHRDVQQRRETQAWKERLVRESKAHAALGLDGDLAVARCQFGAVPGRARRQLAEINQIVPPAGGG